MDSKTYTPPLCTTLMLCVSRCFAGSIETDASNEDLNMYDLDW